MERMVSNLAHCSTLTTIPWNQLYLTFNSSLSLWRQIIHKSILSWEWNNRNIRTFFRMSGLHAMPTGITNIIHNACRYTVDLGVSAKDLYTRHTWQQSYSLYAYLSAGCYQKLLVGYDATIFINGCNIGSAENKNGATIVESIFFFRHYCSLSLWHQVIHKSILGWEWNNRNIRTFREWVACMQYAYYQYYPQCFSLYSPVGRKRQRSFRVSHLTTIIQPICIFICRVCVYKKNYSSDMMQPSSSMHATIVSAENQNGATIVEAIFFCRPYYTVWESNNAGEAWWQSWNESLKSRYTPGGLCETFCCAFVAATMLTMVAAATIVRFPPVVSWQWSGQRSETAKR